MIYLLIAGLMNEDGNQDHEDKYLTTENEWRAITLFQSAMKEGRETHIGTSPFFVAEEDFESID